MDDERIVELFWQRKESAIAETASKYGKYLYGISYRIVENAEDAEECINETYHGAWRSMPPHRPSVLSTFLGKLTRRISLDVWRKNGAQKRGGGEVSLALEELADCVSGKESTESEAERRELVRKFNAFLRGLPQTERQVFICRYWYLDCVSDIAKQFGFSESRVKSMLFRTRKKLRKLLETEGYE